MATTAAQIAAKLEREIDNYGASVEILKYVPGVAGGTYRQRGKFYDTANPVPVQTMRHYGKQEDVPAFIGNEIPYEGTLTFCRNHVLDAFPGATMFDAITEKDHVVFDGKRWRIVWIHKMGMLEGKVQVLYMGFDFRKNKREAAYP